MKLTKIVLGVFVIGCTTSQVYAGGDSDQVSETYYQKQINQDNTVSKLQSQVAQQEKIIALLIKNASPAIQQQVLLIKKTAVKKNM